MEIEKLNQPQIPGAIQLVWNVFSEFEAPEYSQEGINTFRASIQDNAFLASLKFWGAFENNELVGVLATKNNGSHISLFFVKKEYHKKGIGRKLFEEALKYSSASIITVNSSPYAVPIYRKLGFSSIDSEQLTNGIRYTPMQYKRLP